MQTWDLVLPSAFLFKLGLVGVDSGAPVPEEIPSPPCRVSSLYLLSLTLRNFVESLASPIEDDIVKVVVTSEWVSESSVQVVVNRALGIVNSLDVVLVSRKL